MISFEIFLLMLIYCLSFILYPISPCINLIGSFLLELTNSLFFKIINEFVKIAPLDPVVKILFALKDIHPISPIDPECFLLFLHFIITS